MTNNGPVALAIHRTVSCSVILQPCSYDGQNPTVNVGDSSSAPTSFTPSAVGSGTLTLQARLGSATGPIIATSSIAVTIAASTPGMIVATAGLASDSLLAREQCVSLSLGSDAASECGDLRLVHPLPPTRAMGVVRVPTLVYSSGHARPFPIVPANLTLPAGATVPTTVSASLKVNGIERATASWPGNQWTIGGTRRVTIGFDAASASLTTGFYSYTLEITTTYGATPVVTSSSGTLAVVNRTGSAFGTGWWVAGVERLSMADPSSPLWLGGDGSLRRYVLRPGSVAPARVWGAPSVSYPDSIREVGSEFVRQLPDSVWVFFDAQGRHVRTRNRQGHVTTFTYDGSNRLGTIVLPPSGASTTYTFNYGGSGKLSSVSVPGIGGSRTVVVATDAGTGRITSITDPGTSPVRTIQFGYAGDHRITSRTNGRGVQTTFGYDNASRVSSSSLAMNPGAIVRAVTNWQLLGWSGTTHDTSTIRVTLSGPRSGQLTRFRVNRLGAPTEIVDALGQVTTLVRGAAMPGLVSSVTNPAGHTASATYDGRGRILTQSEPSPAPAGGVAMRSFAWDTKWDQVTRVTNPAGDFTDFGVDAATGNRLWQQDARGLMSRTTFGYESNNLLQ